MEIIKPEALDVQIRHLDSEPTGITLDDQSFSAVKEDEEKDKPVLNLAVTNEEASVKLKAMENPKLKVKKDPSKNAPTLDPTMILAILDSIPPYEISLDKTAREICVSRDFMTETFGGSSQGTFPPINARRVAEHGLNDFMYITADWNPHAPSMPGYGGIYYSSFGSGFDEEESEKKKKATGPEWKETQRVFTRLDANNWLYTGQYRLTYCRKITKEEWRCQSAKVRNTWSNNIAERPWGLQYRVRISLRAQLGRSPTQAEVDLDRARAEQSKDKYHHITAEIVTKALDAGEESVVIWRMQCVDYDADFQRQIGQEFQRWVPKPERLSGNLSKKASGKGQGKAKGPKALPVVPKQDSELKRKRDDGPESEFQEKKLRGASSSKEGLRNAGDAIAKDPAAEHARYNLRRRAPV